MLNIINGSFKIVQVPVCQRIYILKRDQICISQYLPPLVIGVDVPNNPLYKDLVLVHGWNNQQS